MKISIDMQDNITTSEFKRPKTMTLRHMLEYLYRQQGNEERFQRALDMPLLIGVHDDHRNFDSAMISNDYPHFRDGVEALEGIHDGSPGMVRIDCHLSIKRMVEKKKVK